MENFVHFNPTKVHFGKDVLVGLGKTAKKYGSKALLLYGKASIKENGIYDKLIEELNSEKITIHEYSGIKPNPILKDVENAIKLAKQKKCEIIVAVGGGSVIDSAKIISLCFHENQNVWDVVKGKSKANKAMPLLAILTLAATGSEMNQFAVLQNPETKEKIGFGHSLMFPKHSFLDPQFTFSVSKSQTTNGIVDLIAHSLEAFFAKGNSPLSDRFIASIILETMQFSEKLLQEPNNYELRARMMWAATCALNGTAYSGKASSGDWGVHDIGHTLSFLYDLPHGQTLSIAYPAWLKFHLNKIPERISELGKLIFGTENPELTIEKLIVFFKAIESPCYLSEIGFSEKNRNEILELMKRNKVSGMNHFLSDNDYEEIVDYMMKI
ncbi:MAG: iron-containing alcohol dehydrogenase [Bacteroidetes bacterium]|jgi:alcohol dehydrogenase YqhD (iron-dependent ADH family)|nr:iron-containing alcohol dehydrogenase [Bacteroidota bacterium]MBT6686451.1 iron-containing alcohol dehydrogenase [Bacteroidota bacterium]MBT7144690.1 iron-containing alcohol dehydrogenase [Bacteroidota bacterium]MBT7491274.1 iron-containing alcohol dehydrogenase [Bacteroidota bacterium]